MEQSEINRRNKLLGEFMGYEFVDEYLFRTKNGEKTFDRENLTYGSNWNSLMYVVDKIEDIDFDLNLGYSVTIVGHVCLIKRKNLTDGSQRELLIVVPAMSKIEAVFIACSDFVEQYNKTKI